MTYLEQLEKLDLKVGSKVLITHKAEDFDKGWFNDWCFEMDQAIGKIGTVIEVGDEYGTCIEIDGIDDFYYPCFVLNTIEVECIINF